VTAIWKRWGEPQIDWYPCSHIGFIAHLPEAIDRMREFVAGLPTPPQEATR
jgi:hypothetical protein